MIDVIVADHQELFHVGMAGLLQDAEDICLMAQPRSAEQLRTVLQAFIPQVLVLSTDFLPAFSKIQPVLKRNRTALLLLAEDNDRSAYMRLRAQGVVYRSVDGRESIAPLKIHSKKAVHESVGSLSLP